MSDLVMEGFKSRLVEFFEQYYDDAVRDIAQDESREVGKVTIDFELLSQFDDDISNEFRDNPDQWLENARAALKDYSSSVSIENPRILVENYREYNPEIRNLRDRHLGKVVCLDGTVSKATGFLHKAHVAAFECRRCGGITKVEQPLQTDLEYPAVCSSEECNNRTERDFRINPTLSKTINFRKIEIQEPPENTSGGETPETETFTIRGEVSDNITAGDNVTCIGIYRASDQGNTSIFQTYVEGINIIPEEEEFEELEISDEEKQQIQELSQQDDIYEKLRNSIAPGLFGLENEKEAILYQLFRGVPKTEMKGTKIRGDIHVLLIGDPGVGKCLKNSNIIQKNGNIKDISEFVEDLMDNPIEDDDGDLVQELSDNVEVLAMDEDAEIESRQVEAIWKKKVDNALKIELEDGRRITSSETHPLFTTDGNAHIEHIEAGDIDEGDYIAIPRLVDYDGSYELDAVDNYNKSIQATELDLPDSWTKELAQFLGLVIAEGHVNEEYSSVQLENEDEELIDIFEEGIRHVGLETTNPPHIDKRDGIKEVSKSSVNLVNFLKELDESMLENSRAKRVPSPLFTAPKEIRRAFIRTYIDGEVHVDSSMRRQLNAGSMSKDLLHDVQRLLDTFGISSRVKTRTNSSTDEGESYRLRITGKAFEKYAEEIGFVSKRKQERAEKIIEDSGELNTNVDVVPDVQDVIKETRELLGMTQSDFSICRSTYHGYEYEGKQIPRDQLQTLVRDMVGKLRALRGFEEIEETELTWNHVDGYRKLASLSQSEVAEDMNLTQTGYGYNVNNNADSGNQLAVQAHKSIQKCIDEDLHTAHENLIRLESLAWGDIRWVPVESVEEVECDDEWFYDLQVEGTHNYIANGIMSHNSQLLRYASKLAPRGVMTSGKGSTEAGLCVGPNTQVLTREGDSKFISSLVDSHIEDAVDTPTAVEVEDMETVSVDDSGEIVNSEVTHLWRMPEQEGVEIEVDKGESLIVSVDTPLITGYEDGNFVWEEADNISVGDSVGVFSDSGVEWSEVRNVDTVLTEMYDMTTTEGNFYANGIVAHNTAAAVRDSEFGGEDKWTLKAGALVLADQGLACVDEIDKMNKSDRSSMHEGLEQQTISISKAGINSTLKSRCTLLAAANPQDGRWNEFDPIAEQIDLAPPLVSRFDLIFAPQDKQSEERDEKLASHILDANQRGQELEAGQTPSNRTNDVDPDINPELFKKYVAYARNQEPPVMTQDAREYINSFYVKIRSEGNEDGAIPVTARKIEAIVRISESVARIRLSDTVDREHAERAKEIVMASLRDVGYDEEAGRFDADMTETSQSTTQKERRNTLLDVIEEHEDEGDKGAPREKVVDYMVEDKNQERDKIEDDLQKLLTDGRELYEPKPGELLLM